MVSYWLLKVASCCLWDGIAPLQKEKKRAGRVTLSYRRIAALGNREREREHQRSGNPSWRSV